MGISIKLPIAKFDLIHSDLQAGNFFIKIQWAFKKFVERPNLTLNSNAENIATQSYLSLFL